jgi:hypothetical protein
MRRDNFPAYELQAVEIDRVPTISHSSRAKLSEKLTRRRWSVSELRNLNALAGVLSVAELCQRLQRSERALRCKLHRLGISAMVREGWSIAELSHDFHLRRSTIRHYAEVGTLRVQSALVHAQPGKAWIHGAASALNTGATRTLSIRDVAKLTHHPCRSVVTLCIAGHYKLTHVRLTESSIDRFAQDPTIRCRLDSSLAQWLQCGCNKGLNNKIPAHVPLTQPVAYVARVTPISTSIK